MLIVERTVAYNQLKKKLARDRQERFIREDDDGASTDSDPERTAAEAEAKEFAKKRAAYFAKKKAVETSESGK